MNLFGYGQVESPYGSGQFIKDLREHFGDDNVALSEIADKDAIYGLDQGLPGERGKRRPWNRAQDAARRTCATSRKEEIEGYAARATASTSYETIFEVLDYDELNEVAAYGGFPTRYPHWRFGMDYEQLSKGYEYGPLEDLRDGHQQRPLLRVPARGQR